MDNSNSKIITLSFAAAGAVVGLSFSLLVTALSAAFGIVARFSDSDFVRHILPVLVGILVFAVLQFNKNVVNWADEVISEIRKVVWPSPKDTWGMTIYVCIMVLISAVIVSVFDWATGFMLREIIG